VLTLNPSNDAARKGLQKLGASTEVDTNAAAGTPEEVVATQAPEYHEPSRRMEHSAAPVVESLFASEREEEQRQRRVIQPASVTPPAFGTDEAWRAQLYQDSPAQTSTPRRRGASPTALGSSRSSNTAIIFRDEEEKQPRSLLDLIATWGEVLIFKMGGEFELEYKNGGFGHVAINALAAGLLQGFSVALMLLIISVLARTGNSLPLIRSISEVLPSEVINDPQMGQLADPMLYTAGLSGVALIIVMLLGIPIIFIGSMIESFVVDRVASALGGKGDVFQTLHAITIATVVQSIIVLPALVIAPFISITIVLYMILGIALYQFVVKVITVSKVHSFGVVAGIGTLLISGFAMNLISAAFSCIFQILAAFGSLGN
jgi:hypothetical protein